MSTSDHMQARKTLNYIEQHGGYIAQLLYQSFTVSLSNEHHRHHEQDKNIKKIGGDKIHSSKNRKNHCELPFNNA